MRSEALFEISPYVALVVFGAGMVARYALATHDGIAETRSRLAEARLAFRGGGLPRLGLLLGGLLVVLLGHLAGLLFPRQIQAWVGSPARLYLLEGVGAIAGVVALFGWAVTAWRHLAQSKSSIASEVADSALLAVLLVALLSGLGTAALYRWGSSWGAATLSPYVRSVVAGAPMTSLVDGLPLLVQLHVFSAFLLLAVLPFSRLALPVVVALHRLQELASRPAAQLTGGAESFLRRRSPAAWLWPEPEYRWVRSRAVGDTGLGADDRRGPRRPAREGEPAAPSSSLEAGSKF